LIYEQLHHNTRQEESQMTRSPISVPARPDGKIAPERLMTRSLSPGQNRLLKHLTDKRRRRHDQAAADFADFELGAA
jgi:hypothetical protein